MEKGRKERKGGKGEERRSEEGKANENWGKGLRNPPEVHVASA